jgi:hypothetical protein
MRYRVKATPDHSSRGLIVETDFRGMTDPHENLADSSESMRLIPWEDIWTSLRVARIRGNGDMIEVFYDTLFKEAVFDDRGAWSLDFKKGY